MQLDIALHEEQGLSLVYDTAATSTMQVSML